MKRFLNYNPKLKKRAAEMRKDMTPSERIIWFQFLKDFSKNNHKVYRQRIIDNFIVDFYIPDFKLIIEIDWDTHFTDEALAYDQERTKSLESEWCKIIRFTNLEVSTNLDWVSQIITDMCKK